MFKLVSVAELVGFSPAQSEVRRRLSGDEAHFTFSN